MNNLKLPLVSGSPWNATSITVARFSRYSETCTHSYRGCIPTTIRHEQQMGVEVQGYPVSMHENDVLACRVTIQPGTAGLQSVAHHGRI